MSLINTGNNSTTILVSPIQNYVKNLSFGYYSFDNSNSIIYSSSPIFYQQQAFSTPNNADPTLNILTNHSSNYNSINKYNKPITRPITKNASINNYYEQTNQLSSSPIFNYSAGYFSTTSSSISLSPSYSPKIINKTPDTSGQSSFNNEQLKSDKKVLPVRSEAINMKEHIENAKKLKQLTHKKLYCTFCKNNNENEEIYSSHLLKDSTGKVTCPVLRCHKCPICGESGDNAHTITYCKHLKKSKRFKILQEAVSRISNQ